ncbi:AAA family ATPase [Kitasatospora sp. NPDC091335]|uniref:AAA family ATPase n=1 Tax=Kitasatospora sp. NPDC091335 TaxID=3364085 RepID=UPI0038073275
MGHLFREHLRMYAETDAAAVAGPTEMRGADDAFVWLALRGAKQYNHCYAWPYQYEQMGWSTTSNLSVRADVFSDVGGFDEDPLTVVGGEDVDLGVRISKTGEHILSNPEALVLHSRSPDSTVRSVAARVFVCGAADGWLCDRHPDTTVYYANPFAITVGAAAVGAAFRHRWPGVARAVGPVTLGFLMVREVASRHQKGSGVRGVIEDVACSFVDLCFDAGEVYAAVRRRSPVNLIRRFDYTQPRWFRRRAARAGDTPSRRQEMMGSIHRGPRKESIVAEEVRQSPVLLLTGPAAAGKTTLADRWARQQSEPTIHISLDDARDWVKSGYASPEDGWNQATESQLGLARRSIALTVRTYAAAGYSAVVDDVVFPNWPAVGLERWTEELGDLPVCLVVLLPAFEVLESRNATRSGRRRLSSKTLDIVYRDMAAWRESDVPVLDTTELDVDQAALRLNDIWAAFRSEQG